MSSWWQHTPRSARTLPAWITREFTVRGLAPPDCTPEALARALERERHITIEFRPLASDDGALQPADVEDRAVGPLQGELSRSGLDGRSPQLAPHGRHGPRPSRGSLCPLD